MSISETTNKIESQKEQISRILDLEPNIQPQNEPQTSVLILNGDGNSLELPEGMTKEQYFELNSLDVRRRNWSTSSCDSSDVGSKLYGNKEIIYHDLEDDDTLQKLALKFNCKISEIKHANKIYKDKELHALRTIKIPVLKDGVLYDEYSRKQKDNEPEAENSDIKKDGFYGSREDKLRVQTKHEINPGLDFLPSSDDEDYDIFDRNASERKSLLPVAERTITIGQPIGNAEPTLADFIERVDIRIQHEIKGVNTKKEDMEKVVDALLSPVVFPADRKTEGEKYGTACYFSWKFYLCVVCVVTVIVPLLYFLHYYHSHRK